MSNPEENKFRRATDKAPTEAIPTPEAVWGILIEIRDRVAAMETVHVHQSEAFVKDDLGKPDYHGHRKAHLKQIKDAEIVENYKVDVTKKILGYIGMFVVGLIVAGFLESVKTGMLK